MIELRRLSSCALDVPLAWPLPCGAPTSRAIQSALADFRILNHLNLFFFTLF